jgi:hypothetical protein
MIDINPGYVPHAIGAPKPLTMTNLNATSGAKGKVAIRPVPTGGITKLFAPIPPPARPRTGPPTIVTEAGPSRLPPPMVGVRSGKRTLATVDEDDAAARVDAAKRAKPTHSRFFAAAPPARPRTPVSPRRTGKENTPLRRRTSSSDAESDGALPVADDDGLDGTTAISIIPIPSRSPRSLPTPDPTQVKTPWDLLPEPASRITQEDGYLSPAAAQSDDDADELSSPARPRIHDVFAEAACREERNEDDGWIRTLDPSAFHYRPPARGKPRRDGDDIADVLSSPPQNRTPPRSKGAVLVPASPAFGDALSEIEDADDEGDDLELGDVPYAEDDDEDLPFTDLQLDRDLEDGLLDDPFLVSESEEATRASKIAVARGWFNKYALPSTRPNGVPRRHSMPVARA